MQPAQLNPHSLRISEIFYSIQGEANTAGLPTVFVRLTGCPLRCHYCDTPDAFHGGKRMDLATIVTDVLSYPTPFVTVTGGEPLAQPACLNLLHDLCDQGLEVSLETSGALDIRAVDRRVSRVLDLKTPGSGECARNLWSNIDDLQDHDQVKFVICDRRDFEWALGIADTHTWPQGCTLWLSPSYQELPASQLATWLLEAGRPRLRLQVQLHKILNCP